MPALAPIRRELLVDADPATAFSIFTDRIGTWWPLAKFSVYGEGTAVAFRDGAIVESAPGRPDSFWGSVTAWEPPGLVAFTWHPGAAPERASQVTVTFTASGQQSLVRLEHSGWEVFTDPAAARSEYEQGWPGVLGSFKDTVRAPVDEEAEGATWVALLHRPGPAAESVSDVYEDPRFAEHVAFLTRMDEAGYLVAAGAFDDEPAAGMTILRLPGTDMVAEATKLAETDDASVAGGFFTVTVRPWRVVMQAPRLD